VPAQYKNGEYSPPEVKRKWSFSLLLGCAACAHQPWGAPQKGFGSWENPVYLECEMANRRADRAAQPLPLCSTAGAAQGWASTKYLRDIAPLVVLGNLQNR
jgi:hypothetical protein